MDAYLIRYAKDRLDRWGHYVERYILDQHGLPSISATFSGIGGKGTIQNGHRILCLDPPKSVWICGYLVSKLPEAEREALEAEHVYKLKGDNTQWDAREKAELLHISYGTFRVRLHRGTKKVALGLMHFA